jgi:hypothetical protein
MLNIWRNGLPPTHKCVGIRPNDFMKSKKEILDRIDVLKSMKDEYIGQDKKIPQKRADMAICQLYWVLE